MGCFEPVNLTDRQKHVLSRVMDDAELLEETLVERLPDCRERDLALSKLEELVMWSSKAISRNGWYYDLKGIGTSGNDFGGD